MRCLSDVRAELENNPIDSRECEKYERVSHHLCPNNMAALYLKMDITHSTVYRSQACMMSMEQATPMD